MAIGQLRTVVRYESRRKRRAERMETVNARRGADARFTIAANGICNALLVDDFALPLAKIWLAMCTGLHGNAA